MRNCDACGSNHVALLRGGYRHEYSMEGQRRVWNYDLLRCNQCGLGFVHPEPTPEILNTFYTSEYGNYQASDTDEGPITPMKRKVARLRTSKIYGKGLYASMKAFLGILAETISGKSVPATLGIPLQLAPQAVIFDLGYGSGAWMRSMVKLGYRNLHGYDIDSNTANAFRLQTEGVVLSHGIFLKNEYPSGAFDCIRLSHVFEHLIDPVAVLRKCRKMLRPGGILVMAHPCFQSWIVEMGLDHSPSLMLPKHLYHHTPMSTRLMLEQAGFNLLEVKPFPVPRQFGAMLNNARKARGKSMISVRVFDALGPIYRLISMMSGRGDFISAWAKAPNKSV